MSVNPPQSGQPMATVDGRVLCCGLKLKVVLWRKISSQCGTVVEARYNCDGCGGYFADSPKSIQYFCHSISPTLWDSDERFYWVFNFRRDVYHWNKRKMYHKETSTFSYWKFTSLLCTTSTPTFTSALQNSTCGQLCSTLKETGLWTAVPTFELLPSWDVGDKWYFESRFLFHTFQSFQPLSFLLFTQRGKITFQIHLSHTFSSFTMFAIFALYISFFPENAFIALILQLPDTFFVISCPFQNDSKEQNGSRPTVSKLSLLESVCG